MHPARAQAGQLKGASASEPKPVKELAAWVLKEFQGAGDRAAVLLDGNMSNEAISAGIAFAREVVRTQNVCVYIPPADEALLNGLTATEAKFGTPEELADCDVLLVVGDPFASHPVISEYILRARRKARGNDLTVIDSMSGRTLKYATTPILVKPGQEAAALAALLKELAPESLPAGIATEMRMAGPAARIKKAAKLGIVIAVPDGKTTAAEAIGALCGSLAQARSAVLVPLFTYGNAYGAYAIARASGLKLFGSAVSSEAFRAAAKLLAVGTSAETLSLVEAKSVVWAEPFARKAGGEVAATLPLAMPFEGSGTVCDGSGRERTIGPVVAPPAGAVSAEELFQMLGVSGAAAKPSLGRTPTLYADRAGAIRLAADVSARAGELLCLPIYDATGTYDGFATRLCSWSRQILTEPVLYLNPKDGSGLGLRSGMYVRLRAGNARLRVRAELSTDVPEGVSAVNSSFPEARKLFAQRIDSVAGLLRITPGSIMVEGVA